MNGIHQLTYIVTAVEYESFSLAAKNLHVTRQAISQAITSAEEELGFRFFLKNGKQLKATENGIKFAKQALSVVLGYKNLMNFKPSQENSTSSIAKLKVGLSGAPHRGNIISSKELIMFNKKANNVFIDLVTLPATSCIRGVNEYSIDAAIIPGQPKLPGFNIKEIGKRKLHALVSTNNTVHSELTGSKISISSLSGKPVAYPYDLHYIYEKLNKYFKTNNLSQPIYEHVSYEEDSVISFIKKGGIILSGQDNKIAERNDGVEIIDFIDDSSTVPIYFIFKEYSENKEELLEIRDFAEYILNKA
jgi:DNA-binding transcriptional LysR family regulator